MGKTTQTQKNNPWKQ